MLAVKKSKNRRLAFSPASAISLGTSIADAARPAGRPDERRRHDDGERLVRPGRFVVVRPDCLGLDRLLDFDAHAPPCFSSPTQCPLP